MKKFFSVAVVILFSVSNLIAFNGIKTVNGENNNRIKAKKDWSVLMTDSFIASHPKYISYDSTKPKWDYEFGFMLYAIWHVYEKTGNQKYYNYIKDNLDYYINNDGQIKTYKSQNFRLDDIEPGRAILNIYKKTGEGKYKQAAFLLRKQLSEQPRTKDGGFWHKKIYEHQMWLDGLYMAEPFYAEFAEKFNEPKDFDDIAHQFILMYEHAKDKNTGLLYHGWDESKAQKWANPKTGDSPSFWGRGMGWYLMGLVDVLDYFPKDNPQRGKLISILQEESKVLLRYKDKRTNLWYLILDKSGESGNYLEASSSAMFMYVFAKGAKKGYLSKKYYSIAKEIFTGFTQNLIKENNDGIPSIINTISGAGLGGKPYRDGSFQYYASEPKRTNDFKAIAPFILASLELGK